MAIVWRDRARCLSCSLFTPFPPSFLNCFTWSCVPDKEAEAHLSEITRRVADVIPEIRWAEWTVRSTVRDVTDMRLNGEEKTKHTLAELVCTLKKYPFRS